LYTLHNVKYQRAAELAAANGNIEHGNKDDPRIKGLPPLALEGEKPAIEFRQYIKDIQPFVLCMSRTLFLKACLVVSKILDNSIVDEQRGSINAKSSDG
jgi:hypothetical protein